MRALPFDTLAFVKRLAAAGVPQSQAEAMAEGLAEVALAQLATKDDLRAFEENLRKEISDLGTGLRRETADSSKDLRTEMTDLRKDLRTEMKDLELRLTLRVGAMLAASIAIIVALIKLL
jgi:hypothetical protein